MSRFIKQKKKKNKTWWGNKVVRQQLGFSVQVCFPLPSAVVPLPYARSLKELCVLIIFFLCIYLCILNTWF